MDFEKTRLFESEVQATKASCSFDDYQEIEIRPVQISDKTMYYVIIDGKVIGNSDNLI